ncbi:MAG: HNH endonuclease family protein [Micrococcales bacterium]
MVQHKLSKAFGLLAALALVASVGVAEAQPADAASGNKAVTVLAKIAVKGRAPKTGYARSKFSDGWSAVAGCDTRNLILQRDLRNIVLKNDGCTVKTGTLKDPYTGKTINFVRGVGTSSKVQIDHVVALSDAWQKGAQKLSSDQRFNIYHDPLNLLAVDGPTNGKKSDSDAASWLPPNKSYRCAYVARQIAVKYKYGLWVTSAEKSAMLRVLSACPNQKIPLG